MTKKIEVDIRKLMEPHERIVTCYELDTLYTQGWVDATDNYLKQSKRWNTALKAAVERQEKKE